MHCLRALRSRAVVNRSKYMVSMRTHVAARLLVLMALVAAFVPMLAPSSWTVEIPATLHRKIELPISASARTSAARKLPFTATHLGLGWRGTDEVGPELRTSRDGTVWSNWSGVTVSEDLSDHEAGIYFAALESGRDAQWAEVRVPPTVDPASVVLTAINTRDGPSRKITVRRQALAATPQPNVISRAQWGADETLRRDQPRFARVRRLVVHHTVTANDDTDPAGTIRAIYAYHVQSRGWDDIGYNFLVDSNGNIYEGRYSRPLAQGELPNGENTNGMGVIGAHAAGYNTGSAGVALLGNFSSVSPRPAAVVSLVNLLAWKADRHGIGPLGAAQGIPNIAGHRDVGSTACPGDLLYAQLPGIRNDVETRIQVTTSLTPPAMPTGTELLPSAFSRDKTPNATGAVSRSATLVELRFDGRGLLADRTFRLTPANGSFSLSDSDFGGISLAEDHYAVRAVAFDAQLRESPAAPVASDYVISLGEAPATGYWIMGSDGGVFSFGSAKFYGSTGGLRLNKPVVGMDATPTSDGYWLVATDGGVFAFGSAGFFGSTGSIRLNRPIVDLVSASTGNGYWMVASDGGIFAFGDSRFFGSTGGITLNQPIVGMAPTPTGGGYWLVASDGGIFAYGDARFFGSTGGIKLSQPIIGMAPTPTGGGYWMVASDGGIFAFGDAGFFGSGPSRGIRTRVVGFAATFTGGGYYLLGEAGSVNAFGDAPFYGSLTFSGIRATARDLALVR